MASEFYDNAVFWIEVNRIQPNPFQPRREFDQEALESLADSIRQYGVLQPLVVTRKEFERGDGGISVEYELVAGERRLRASKLAQLTQVPVLIRSSEDSDKMKLEIAIIENLQREDLNPIDRALAFKQLADNFNLKHIEIAKKVGKSREYVSNSLRLLALPSDIQSAVIAGHITEGHTRPILMLSDRKQQQDDLFNEIIAKKLTVREAERIARGIAVERARKQDLSPELATLERALTEKLGTRVQIDPRENGGKVHIDFFSQEDIQTLLSRIGGVTTSEKHSAEEKEVIASATEPVPSPLLQFTSDAEVVEPPEKIEETIPEEEEEDLYSLKNFVV
tara:strand:- start:2746 stop:3753 length:1008 start_codon:yes stop_codon:yes gene_type:complete